MVGNTTNMGLDNRGNTIPLLSLRPEGAHQVSVTDTTAANDTAFDEATIVVTLFATEDMYIEFGDDTVEATDESHFLAKGIYMDYIIRDRQDLSFDYVAALQVTTAGTLYISERL